MDLIAKDDELKSLALTVEEGQEEHLSQDELEIPFLRVAQKGTPQVNEDDPACIKGLKPGAFFNTASQKIYGETCRLVVLGYFRNFVIWQGEKGQGVFSGTMTPEEFETFSSSNELERDGGDYVQMVDGEMYRHTDTRNFLVLAPEFIDDGPMIFPMSSTGIKPAKKWNTLNRTRKINGKLAKRYATVWELGTDSFKKDNWTWKQVSKISALGWVSGELAEIAKGFEAFAEDIKANADKVKYSEDAHTGEETEF